MLPRRVVVEEHHIDCSPASVTDAVVIQDGWQTFLVFEANSVQQNEEGYLEDKGFALIEIEACSSIKAGYPNDEGSPEHPLYKYVSNSEHFGFFRFQHTPYLNEITNQKNSSSKRIWEGRGMKIEHNELNLFHFLVFLKETTFECIAESLKVVGYFETSHEASQEALRRIHEAT